MNFIVYKLSLKECTFKEIHKKTKKYIRNAYKLRRKVQVERLVSKMRKDSSSSELTEKR